MTSFWGAFHLQAFGSFGPDPPYRGCRDKEVRRSQTRRYRGCRWKDPGQTEFYAAHPLDCGEDPAIRCPQANRVSQKSTQIPWKNLIFEKNIRHSGADRYSLYVFSNCTHDSQKIKTDEPIAF
jgi:hypothetical protein